MFKLTVGIIVSESYKPESGGAYSYYQRLLSAIDEFDFDEKLEIVFISFSRDIRVPAKKRQVTVDVPNNIQKNIYDSVFSRLNRSRFYKFFIEKVFHRPADFVTHNKIEKILSDKGIELLYYLTPTDNIYEFPSIVTHWDVGHKSMMAFPEVTYNGEFNHRQKCLNEVVQKAFAIFVESKAGAEELMFYERVNKDRIFVVPLFSGPVINVIPRREQKEFLEQYKLEKRSFFFYPAQFWSHKNHITLLYAFKKFLTDYPDFKLILTGSDNGNLKYVEETISQLGIKDSAIIKGFVSDEELYHLYTCCQALIMPTFLGPTNMPLSEAKELGCKVLCSDLPGHREQMCEGALYFNPLSPQSIYNKMLEVLSIDFPKQTKGDSSLNVLKSIEANLLQIGAYRKVFRLE